MKTTMTNLRGSTARQKKEKELPKPGLELRFAIMFVPRLISLAHAVQLPQFAQSAQIDIIYLPLLTNIKFKLNYSLYFQISFYLLYYILTFYNII